jgi:cytochrome c553
MGGAGKLGLVIAALLAGASPALAADLSEKMAPCLACHGEVGQSQNENVPSLGAQQASYTVIQLYVFREKIRVTEPMNEMAKELTDGDLQSIADALAALPAPKPPADPGDPTRLQRARTLSEQYHCNTCHRPDFSGRESVPRLADQREDYLLKTLRDYKSGARHAYEPIMVEVLQPISDADMVELSYYLAHLRLTDLRDPQGAVITRLV